MEVLEGVRTIEHGMPPIVWLYTPGYELNVVEAVENCPRVYSTQPLAEAQASAEYSSEALMVA